MSNTDFAKIAAEYHITEEKLSQDITLLKATLQADGSLDKIASDPKAFNYLLHHFINFEKSASSQGYDLAESKAQAVVDGFNDYVNKMAEEEKKEEKKEKKDEKDENDVDKKAAAYEAKLAEAAQVEDGWRQAGRFLAQGYIEEIKAASTDSREARALAAEAAAKPAAKLKDLAEKAKGKLGDLKEQAKLVPGALAHHAKEHPGHAAAAAAGLAAGGYALKKHLDSKKEGSAGPADEQKKAFDFKAAQIALQKLAEANYDQQDGINRLQHVIDYEAAHGGNMVSEGVKAASASGQGLHMRAWELLAQAGYEVVEKG